MYGVAIKALNVVNNVVNSDNPEQAKSFWRKTAEYVDRAVAKLAAKYPNEVRTASAWVRRRLDKVTV